MKKPDPLQEIVFEAERKATGCHLPLDHCFVISAERITAFETDYNTTMRPLGWGTDKVEPVQGQAVHYVQGSAQCKWCGLVVNLGPNPKKEEEPAPLSRNEARTLIGNLANPRTSLRR